MSMARCTALYLSELVSLSRASSAEFSSQCANVTGLLRSTGITAASASKGCSTGLVLNTRLWQSVRLQHTAAAPSTLENARLLLRNYKQLCKSRLSTFVVLTAGAGYVLGSGTSVDMAGLFWTSFGTFACAASANSLNQIYERVNDSLMQRTRNRPLPTGRLSVAHALMFAAVTGVAGVTMLAEKTNTTTAALGASNILLYAGIYTPMKQLTIWNTWLGAIVGAVPPLMGWAAATGELTAGSAVLAATLYFWQLPHFLALAWMCKDDYARGGFRMISMFDATGKRTAAAAIRNCIYLLPVGLLAAGLGVSNDYYTAENTALSLGLAYFATRFWQSPSRQSAQRLFRMSLVYLPISLACVMVHRVPQTSEAVVSTHSSIEVTGASAVETVIDALRTGVLNLHAAFLAAISWSESLWPGSNDLKCPSKAYGDSGEGEEGRDTAVSVQEAEQETDKVQKE